MNLPAAISPTTTSFAEARKSRRLRSARARASGRRTSPSPCRRSPRSRGRSRRRARRRACRRRARGSRRRRRRRRRAPTTRRPRRSRGPCSSRMRPRQQRALHRVRELLLLLVQAAVVDRERRLRGDRQRRVERLAHDRPARVERDDRQRPDRPRPGVAIGTTAAVEPFSRNGASSRCDPPSSFASCGREHERPARAEQPLDGERVERLRQRRAPVDTASHEPRVAHVDARASDELVAALVRHADHGRVDVEQLHGAPRERLERRVEREALRERLRDLVERANAPRRRRAPASRASCRSGRARARACSCRRAFWTAIASCAASAPSSASSYAVDVGLGRPDRRRAARSPRR